MQLLRSFVHNSRFGLISLATLLALLTSCGIAQEAPELCHDQCDNNRVYRCSIDTFERCYQCELDGLYNGVCQEPVRVITGQILVPKREYMRNGENFTFPVLVPFQGLPVILADRDGTVVDETTLDEEGRFLLYGDDQGLYRVVLKAISFEDRISILDCAADCSDESAYDYVIDVGPGESEVAPLELRFIHPRHLVFITLFELMLVKRKIAQDFDLNPITQILYKSSYDPACGGLFCISFGSGTDPTEIALEGYTYMIDSHFAYAQILAHDIVNRKEWAPGPVNVVSHFSLVSAEQAWATGLSSYLSHYLVDAGAASYAYSTDSDDRAIFDIRERSELTEDIARPMSYQHPHAIAHILWNFGESVGHEELVAHLNSGFPPFSNRNAPGIDIIDFFDSWMIQRPDDAQKVLAAAELYRIPYEW